VKLTRAMDNDFLLCAWVCRCFIGLVATAWSTDSAELLSEAKAPVTGSHSYCLRSAHECLLQLLWDAYRPAALVSTAPLLCFYTTASIPPAHIASPSRLRHPDYPGAPVAYLQRYVACKAQLASAVCIKRQHKDKATLICSAG
jgi:hypothetical protein